MSNDKMRDEFEAWAKDYYGYASDDLAIHGKFYIYSTVEECWQIWQDAYQAGLKAERDAILSEFDSVADGYTWQVRMAFNAMAAKIRNKPEGDDE